MHLALFDLDHTLLPIDSDHTWAAFLGRQGAIDTDQYEARNDAFYRQYQAGTLDIHEFLAFALKPLADHPRAQLDAWHRQYMHECIEPNIRPAARELVARHRQRHDLIAIITATNEFVTRPIAAAFGVEHLLAVQLEQRDGRFTGRPTGTPSSGKARSPVCTNGWPAAAPN